MAKPISSTPPLKSKDFLKLLKEDAEPVKKLTGEALKKEKELRKNITKKFTFGKGVSF